MKRTRYAVIVAGGHGVRMGLAVPKQMLEIEGKPILRHTVERFLELDIQPRIIIVLPTDLKDGWKRYCAATGFLSRYDLPSGGITRFHSVQNALKYVEDGSIVAVHDAVRPFVSKSFLERLFVEAEDVPALVPAIGLTDSVREVNAENCESRALDRSALRLVQTPQMFHSEVLRKAYEAAYRPCFTDDASVVEAAGYKIKLTPGEKLNIKITTPEDLVAAKAIFSSLKDGRQENIHNL